MGAVYLDHNATTPLAPEVREAMLPFLERGHGNPSCGHRLGREAREAIERARATCAAFFGCATDEVVFTSGGTEGNNLALKGAAWQLPEDRRHILIGAAEHPSVSHAVRFLTRFGFEVDEVPTDATGKVLPAALAAALRPNTGLVSIMHAQNVVGTVNPVDELAEVLRGRPILFHVDAAQSVGKIPASFLFSGADFMTVAGHKFYGPKGVGCLLIRRGRSLEPLFHGAGHERGLRAGTENTAGIVGLGAAVELAQETMVEAGERVVALRDLLHARLASALPGVVLNGHPHDRLPNTLNLSFLGVTGAAIAERVPELMLATGPACHDRAAVAPGVFGAMGLDAGRSSSTLRLTLGRSNTRAEIEQAAEQLIAAVQALRAQAGALPPEADAPSELPSCPRVMCERPLAFEDGLHGPELGCERGACPYLCLAPPPGVEV